MLMLPPFLTLSCFYLNSVTTLDTITASWFIKDPETVSSRDGAFKLGFFCLQNTSNRYVAIWYLSDSNVVWVTNRAQPLHPSSGSGILTISHNGNLVLWNAKKHVVWSSNVSRSRSSNSTTTAPLLNTGNLVLHGGEFETIIWESFKHPSDTFLPNSILSTNTYTGERVKVTSWKSPSDPNTENFSRSLETRLSAPKVFVWNQMQPHWRSGPWNGQVFIGLDLGSNFLYNFAYLNGFSVEREDNRSVDMTYTLPNASFFGTAVVSSEGKIRFTAWINRELVGKQVFQVSDCDFYGFCGSYGSCDSRNSPTYNCLRGFELRNIDEWNRQN